MIQHDFLHREVKKTHSKIQAAICVVYFLVSDLDLDPNNYQSVKIMCKLLPKVLSILCAPLWGAGCVLRTTWPYVVGHCPQGPQIASHLQHDQGFTLLASKNIGKSREKSTILFSTS